MTNIRTEAGLLERLKIASSRRLTLDEIERQRVSFIMGMVGNKSGVTREKVRAVLDKQEGRKVAG